MRIAVSVVLLLLTASGVRAQTPTVSSAIASDVAVAPLAPVSSQPVAVPTTATTQAVTDAAVQAEPTAAVTQGATQTEPTIERAQVATTTGFVQEDPPRRSRVLWILVGVVIVLGIIVVAR